MSTSIDEVKLLKYMEAQKRQTAAAPLPHVGWRVAYLGALSDLCALAAAMGFAWTVHRLVVGQENVHWRIVPGILVLLVFALQAWAGQYRELIVPWSRRIWSIIRAQLVVLVAGGAASAVAGGGLETASDYLLPVLVYLPFSLMAWQLTIAGLRIYRASPRHRTFVLGVGQEENERLLRDHIQPNLESGWELTGWLKAGVLEGTDYLLRKYLSEHPVDMVLLAGFFPDDRKLEALAESTTALGLDFGVALDYSELESLPDTGPGMHTEMSGLRLFLLPGVHQNAAYLIMKRFVDVTLSALGLITLSPLLLAVALLVRFTSPGGPILYRWAVLGKNRKPFIGFKFRTMVPNADELKSSLMEFNEMSGAVFKMRDDPRITPVGRWLRKFSIDELPQLYSVLKGDMSLVGPRPPSKAESLRFEYWQHRKLSVKPGITCLWQVSGRNNISDFSEWVALDLEYIRTAGLWTDFKILLRTIPVVLFGSGAC